MPDADSYGSQGESREEVPCELVVAGCDTTEVFETSKHALDQVALAIEPFVIGEWLATAGGGWNDCLGALFSEKRSQTIGIVGLVGDQPLDRSGRNEKSRRQRDIVDIAWR